MPLNTCGDKDGIELEDRPHAVRLAPSEELADCPRICLAGVPVPDVRSKELQEEPGGSIVGTRSPQASFSGH
jgi:hypothetical protein